MRRIFRVQVDGNLSDLVKAISRSKRNLFPVVNEEKELVGVINMDDVRDIIFNTELYDKISIIEIMQTPPAIIDRNENMGKVLEIFEETESWNLPVTYQGKYTGFISRSKIFTSYRNMLKPLINC